MDLKLGFETRELTSGGTRERERERDTYFSINSSLTVEGIMQIPKRATHLAGCAPLPQFPGQRNFTFHPPAKGEAVAIDKPGGTTIQGLQSCCSFEPAAFPSAYARAAFQRDAEGYRGGAKTNIAFNVAIVFSLGTRPEESGHTLRYTLILDRKHRRNKCTGGEPHFFFLFFVFFPLRQGQQQPCLVCIIRERKRKRERET